MVKVAVYMMAFYLLYSLLLRRDTAYGRNRAFILLSLVFSGILPFFSFTTTEPLHIQFFGRLLSGVFIDADNSVNNETAFISARPLKIIYAVYIAGVMLFMAKLAINFTSLLILILKGQNCHDRVIKFRNSSASGFSAMGYIFINEKLTEEDAEAIIEHEKHHLRQNHYIDIILLEFLISLQWFNPFIYLFNRELRSLHEYQADRDCLRSGIPVLRYQNLILSQVFRTGALNITSNFSNPSLVRKRFLMMTRKRSTGLANLKLLSAIPVTSLIFFSTSVNNVASLPEDYRGPAKIQLPGMSEAPYSTVEVMPVFPGGDVSLLKFISENIIYPEEAKAQNIQGRVTVKFCITSSGNINQVSIVSGIHPQLDAEALRVVSGLPRFEPGRQNGIAVPVWYYIPITFTLR